MAGYEEALKKVQARMADPEFVDRLRQNMARHAELLARLAEDDGPGVEEVDLDFVTVPKTTLAALLDALEGSMDFGSGFLCEEEVREMKAAAVLLGRDPNSIAPYRIPWRPD